MSDKVAYGKAALELPAQVALMQSRGLQIPDTSRAEHYLRYVGYYRLVGYARHFRANDPSNPESYQLDVGFDDVLNLYIFDRKVRLLLFDAIERVEVAIRTSINNVGSLTGGGPFWLTDANNFDYGQHQKIVDEITAIITDKHDNKQHSFISHFYNNYTDPYPPSWMLMECLSAGAVSRIYKLMKGQLRIEVAKPFGLQHDILESWIHSITHARNVCAHHSRCWKKIFTISPKIPKQYQALIDPGVSRRLYMQCWMLHHFMNVIADGSMWSDRLRELIASRPRTTLADMGFPEDWEEKQFWGFAKG